MSRTSGRHAAAVLVATLSFAAFLPVVLEKPVRLAVATPADRAVLATPPAAVSLTFSDELDQRDSHASTFDATGAIVDQQSPTVNGNALTLPVRIGSPGRYTVQYHVRLLAGGDLTGQTVFVVGDPALLPPARPVETVAHHSVESIDPVTAVVLGANVIVLFGIGVQLLRRRRPRQVISTD